MRWGELTKQLSRKSLAGWATSAHPHINDNKSRGINFQLHSAQKAKPTINSLSMFGASPLTPSRGELTAFHISVESRAQAQVI